MQWAIALSALFAVVVHICVGRRPRNLFDEQSQTKTTLHILDDNIVEYLTHPSKATSQALFDEIEEYNKHFKEIIHGFQERKFRFVRIAHVIYDKGGPNFMKHRIDGPLFFKVSGWTMNDMGELYHYLKYTNRLWQDFKTTYEEVKTAVGGNWTQLRSTYHGTLAPDSRWNMTAIFQSFAESSGSEEDASVPQGNETLTSVL